MSSMSIIENGKIVNADASILEILQAKLRGGSNVTIVRREQAWLLEDQAEDIRRMDQTIIRLKVEIAELDDRASNEFSVATEAVCEAADQLALLMQEDPDNGEALTLLSQLKLLRTDGADPESLAGAASGIATRAIALRRHMKQQAAKALERKKALLDQASALLAKAGAMEKLTLPFDTPQGRRELPARVDLRTNGLLTTISGQIAGISDFADREGLDAAEAALAQWKRQLEELPDLAQKVMRLEAARNTQIYLIGKRAKESGWQSERLPEGDGALDPVKMMLNHKSGACAECSFNLNGDVQIHYLFGPVSVREEFQKLVLDTLIKAGAKNARKRCLDGEDEQRTGPEQAQIPDSGPARNRQVDVTQAHGAATRQTRTDIR